MNLDQRLEALAKSLELIAHMQRDNEQKHEAHVAETDERLNRLNETVKNISEIARNISEVTADFNCSIAVVTFHHTARLHRFLGMRVARLH